MPPHELTSSQRAKLVLLEASLGIQPDDAHGEFRSAGGTAVCAAIKREVELQYRFLTLYQTLVLLLAIGVLALLAVATWRLMDGAPVGALLAGSGAIVSGAAAVFLLRQRADARDSYAAAREGLAKHNCR
jgi:hypothetical protein